MVERKHFVVYAWNAGPVYETDIFRSVVDIGGGLLFPIDLSPERSREGTSEGQQALDHFEAVSPLLFIKIDMFNILVSERRLIHRELRNKGNIRREFYKGYILVLKNQVKSSKKYGIANKLVFLKRDPIEFSRRQHKYHMVFIACLFVGF